MRLDVTTRTRRALGAVAVLGLVTSIAAPAAAGPVVYNAFGVHGGTIDDSVPGTITAVTGNDPNYHWNKSSWATRTGQKAFYITSEFNGLPVSTITTVTWDVLAGYWGNAYFNVMVEDVGGKKAILAPSLNSAASPGWGDMGALKNYAVFEAEAGWTGTAAVGFNAANWNEVKDLIITDGPFTEFPDTLTGAATMQGDPVYTAANWAAWADLAAGGDFDWEKGGFMITFGQSTGTTTPLTTITNIVLEPTSVIDTGACCFGCLHQPYNCQVMAADECNEFGGDYLGDDSVCIIPPPLPGTPGSPACPFRPRSPTSPTSGVRGGGLVGEGGSARSR